MSASPSRLSWTFAGVISAWRTRPLSSSTGKMRFVTEMGLVALARETRRGVARIDAAALIRAPHGACDDGRVDQRAALDDKAARVELPVDLRQELRRQAKLVDRLAKPADRGVAPRRHCHPHAPQTAAPQ